MRASLSFYSTLCFGILTLLAESSHGLQVDSGSGIEMIVSTRTGTTEFNGLNINELIGATRFYENGYTGSRAIAGVVEGGHIWNGHQTLNHVSEFFDARHIYDRLGIDSGQLGEVSRHPTWVGHTLAGRNENARDYQQGIAYGAELWSGAMATVWPGAPNTSNFDWSRGFAYSEPYAGMALDGRNGQVADVINSSWGLASASNPGIRGGNSIFTLAYDGMARQSGAVFVSSAGNDAGNPSLSLVRPGNGYNGITVGATGNDLDDPPYSQLASFSSRGAQDYNGPDGFVANARAVVDIVAPGENLTLAFYGGATGSNLGGSDPSNGVDNWYSFNVGGTSFSAPIVSGGAALLVDVAKDRFVDNLANAKNSQVIKSVLMNSADKPAEWTNGLELLNGTTYVTKQAVDYSWGAGRLDLNAAFDQYTAGTTDLEGFDGGIVEELGWDFGIVEEGSYNDYFFDDKLLGGSTFTATLNWFVGRDYTGTTDGGTILSNDLYFTDLSLELWTLQDGDLFEQLVISDADYVNKEHFTFTLPETSNYLLRVNWDGERYDFVDNDSQTYGIAWSAHAVPEPATVLLLLLFAIAVACHHYRRRHRSASVAG